MGIIISIKFINNIIVRERAIRTERQRERGRGWESHYRTKKGVKLEEEKK